VDTREESALAKAPKSDKNTNNELKINLVIKASVKQDAEAKGRKMQGGGAPCWQPRR